MHLKDVEAEVYFRAIMKKAMKAILVLVVITIVGGALYAAVLRPSLVIPKAEVKERFTLPTSHFLRWRGAEIHYTDEGQGMPVVMIHGFGGSFMNWNKLQDRTKDDYRVIRLDLPGFGLSELPQPHNDSTDFVKQYRDFMTFFIDTLHLDSLYMVGNSLGGMMSWATAADHPDRVKKMVLISSAGYDLENVANKVSSLLRTPFMERFLVRGIPLSVSKVMAEKIYADFSKANMESVRNNNMILNKEGNIHAACTLACSRNYPDSGLITKVQCPTLIIWGREDKIVPLEHASRFVRDIKGSQLLIFDTCGHCAMMEKPDETAAAIKKFFNQ